MRKIIHIFFLAVFSIPCFAQYTVTKVNGTVKNKSTNEILKPGSHFNENDKLEWSSPNDLVRTIIAGKGIFIITQSPQAEREGSKVMEIVKFSLHLKSKEYNLSGRGDDDDLVPVNLNTETFINTKNLIAEENKYLFDKTSYDVSDGNKFFLQTEMPGTAPVIKSLQTNADTLLLYSADFKKSAEANPAGTKYKLGFYSKEDKSSKLLVQINPYFDSTGEMEGIIKLMIASDEKSDKEKMKEQCYQEIYQALGKPSGIVFQNTFDKIFDASLRNSTGKN